MFIIEQFVGIYYTGIMEYWVKKRPRRGGEKTSGIIILRLGPSIYFINRMYISNLFYIFQSILMFCNYYNKNYIYVLLNTPFCYRNKKI